MIVNQNLLDNHAASNVTLALAYNLWEYAWKIPVENTVKKQLKIEFLLICISLALL